MPSTKRLRLDSFTAAEAKALLTIATEAEAGGFAEGEMFDDARGEAAAMRAIEKLRQFAGG